MKTKRSLQKSANACLNQVAANSMKLNVAVQRQKLSPSGDNIAEMRDLAESVLQATHEYSAYYNCLETE